MMHHSRFLPLILAIIFTLFGSICAAPIPTPNTAILHSRAPPFIRFTADPKEWPTRAQLEAAVKTGPNQAFFWSGLVGGVSVVEKAAEFASAAGGVTLELALSRSGLSMPNFKATDSPSDAKWEEAANLYASLASGEAFFVQGQLRPGNVFEKIELPALKANKNIKGVTKIDVNTKEKSSIFRAT